MRTSAIVTEQHVLLLNAARLFQLAGHTTAGEILLFHLLQFVRAVVVAIPTAVLVLLDVITLTVMVFDEKLDQQLVPELDARLLSAVKVLNIAIHTRALKGV